MQGPASVVSGQAEPQCKGIQFLQGQKSFHMGKQAAHLQSEAAVVVFSFAKDPCEQGFFVRGVPFAGGVCTFDQSFQGGCHAFIRTQIRRKQILFQLSQRP